MHRNRPALPGLLPQESGFRPLPAPAEPL